MTDETQNETKENPVTPEPTTPEAVSIKNEPFEELPADKPEPDITASIALLADTLSKFTEQVDQFINNQHPPSEKWMNAYLSATPYALADERFISTIARETALWRQGVEKDGELYGVVSPKPAIKGSVLTGANSRAAVRAAAGGIPNKIIQLPHSGVVLNMEGLNRGKIFELENFIASTRVPLGMETQGGVFGNNSSLLTEALVQYMIPRIVRHNIKDINSEDLLDTILLTDFPVWVNGFAGATYQNTHPVSIPCGGVIGDENKTLCSYVYKANININRLYWVDNFELTDKQREILSNRTGQYTIDDIRKYQESFKFVKNVGRRKITDRLAIELQVPTIAQYLRAGNDWINSLVNQAEQLFTGRKSEKELKDYMIQQAGLQPISQYSSWIKSLVILEDESDEVLITEREDILENLESLMDDPEITEVLLKAIIEFINACTVAIIGMPIPVCPSCKQPLDGHPKYPRLHPIDPIANFFTLARLKR